MGREVKRVPLDFAWALNERWWGFLLPETLCQKTCVTCEGTGESPAGRLLSQEWYGNAPFRPEDRGSTPHTIDMPEVRGFAERNVASAPEFYGAGEAAIVREATRLAKLWNGMWMHHLDQDDVDALLADNQLRYLTHSYDPVKRWQPKDPMPKLTAAEVNRWSLTAMVGSIAAWSCIDARAKRLGLETRCSACNGEGSIEKHAGQRQAAEAHENVEPPTGAGYQLWETVSEGSPISPVFGSPEGLASWMVENRRDYEDPISFEAALRFIDVGWAPTAVSSSAGMTSGDAWVGEKKN